MRNSKNFKIILIQTPIDTRKLDDLSHILLSSDNRVLELRLSSNGYWRQKVSLNEVDPLFVKMLIAYEDQRFYEHLGVNFKAIARASKNLLLNRKVVSGASTITMQLAKLLKPNLSKRTVLSKLKQMAYFVYPNYSDIEMWFLFVPISGILVGCTLIGTINFIRIPSAN